MAELRFKISRTTVLELRDDGLEDLDLDCDGLQLQTTSIFKANHVYAFDSNCDEAGILLKNDAAQSVPPSEQDNAMIFSVIEQMQSQVE
ncbi:hypothetical protein Tco_0389935 [Tanacetum coccineum]